jgi:hypothetical protein
MWIRWIRIRIQNTAMKYKHMTDYVAWESAPLFLEGIFLTPVVMDFHLTEHHSRKSSKLSVSEKPYTVPGQQRQAYFLVSI